MNDAQIWWYNTEIFNEKFWQILKTKLPIVHVQKRKYDFC
jgi:hypothetical protein